MANFVHYPVTINIILVWCWVAWFCLECVFRKDHHKIQFLRELRNYWSFEMVKRKQTNNQSKITNGEYESVWNCDGTQSFFQFEGFERTDTECWLKLRVAMCEWQMVHWVIDHFHVEKELPTSPHHLNPKKKKPAIKRVRKYKIKQRNTVSRWMNETFENPKTKRSKWCWKVVTCLFEMLRRSFDNSLCCQTSWNFILVISNVVPVTTMYEDSLLWNWLRDARCSTSDEVHVLYWTNTSQSEIIHLS